jgi:PAS domain S-box-containing protein
MVEPGIKPATRACAMHKKISKEFQLLFDQARDIILLVDPDTGAIAHANWAATQAYGYSLDELKQLTIFDIRRSPSPADVRAQMDIAAEGGIQFETVHYRKDGTAFPVDVSASIAVIAERRVIMSMIRDITERKQAELAQKQSETRMRSILDNIIAFVAELDPDGIVRFVNLPVFHVSGVTPEDVLGKQFWECFWFNYDPELMDQIEDSVRRAQRGEAVQFDFTAQLVEGFLEVQYRIAPTYGPDGEIVGLIASGVDITARVASEVALRESENRYRVATTAGQVGVWEWEVQTGKVRWCDQTHRIHGIEPGCFEGSVDDFIRRIYPEDLERVDASLKHSLATGEPYVIELRIVRESDGEIRWLHTRAELQYDEEGRPYKMAGSTLDITANKQIEDDLRKTAAILETINESRSMLVFMKDTQGRLTYANQATLDLLGITEEEAIGKNDREYLDEGEGSEIADNDRLVREIGSFHVFDEVATGKFGEQHFITTKAPFRNAAGEIIGTVGVSIDITERKRVEMALRESEERFRTMADSAPVMIWVTDQNKELTYINEPWIKFTGRDLEEQLGHGWTESIHPEDHETTVKAYFDAFEREEPIEIEYRLRRHDGVYRWIIDRGTPRYAPDGTLMGYIGSCIDVTDRKESEQALKNSERRLAVALEGGQMGVWSWHYANDELYWDDRMYAIFDLDPDTAPKAGESFFELVHPDDRPMMDQQRDELKAGAETLNSEFRIFDRKGQVRWIAGRSTVIRKNGAPEMIVGVVFDITERKLNEQRLRSLLESEQAARAEAERQIRLKDEFLATLSHELRTPLTSVLGWAQLLKRGQRSADEVARGLEVIERNAKTQTQLIDDLLDMSRLSAGKIHIDLETVDLARVLEDAIESMRHAAEAKGVALANGFDRVPSLVRGDRGRLQQIIWNLLSNAIKFTPSGGVISVSLERDDNYISIHVQDTGQGISPEFLPFVFERFRQADASTTRRYGGLGLGLSIVKQLVELHGGEVSVLSAGIGKGARFTVRLPAIATHTHNVTLFKEKFPAVRLSGISVMVIDDDADHRELAGQWLENAGATVTRASGAAEAMQLLGEQVPDVVVSDISMPGEDGISLIRRILKEAPEVRAIALTAAVQPEDASQLRDAGFEQYLQKPTEERLLLSMVSTVAKRRSQTAPL